MLQSECLRGLNHFQILVSAKRHLVERTSCEAFAFSPIKFKIKTS